MAIGDRELIELARKALRAKQQAQAQRREPPANRDRGLEDEDREWIPDVRQAERDLRAIDEGIQEHVRMEGARRNIQGALERVNEMAAVKAAEADLGALQGHMDRDHWPTGEGLQQAARTTDPRQAMARKAFLWSQVFGRPRAMEPEFSRPDWQGPWKQT